MTRVVPVVVVLPPRALLLDVAGPIEVLRQANRHAGLRFDVRYVGPAARVVTSVGLVVSEIGALPESLPAGAWLVVPGDGDDPLDAGAAPGEPGGARAIVAWLRQVVRADTVLVSICSGALLAGRAGLLDGVRCTTHHACTGLLEQVAPRARVVADRLYVGDSAADGGARWSSAGVTAGIDLVLHLVAEACGPTVAVAAARTLVVYARRAGADDQVSPWLQGRDHLHPVVHRAQDAIAADPAAAWTVASVARAVHASPRTVSRLFNAHAGCSVPAHVARLRVAVAATLLRETRLDMERVAERAGFTSARQLRRAWGRVKAGPPRVERATPETF